MTIPILVLCHPTCRIRIWLFGCMYVLYACMMSYKYWYIYTPIQACMHYITCTYMQKTCMELHTYHIHACSYMHIHAHTWAHVHMDIWNTSFTHTHAHINIYMYIHTETCQNMQMISPCNSFNFLHDPGLPVWWPICGVMDRSARNPMSSCTIPWWARAKLETKLSKRRRMQFLAKMLMVMMIMVVVVMMVTRMRVLRMMMLMMMMMTTMLMMMIMMILLMMTMMMMTMMMILILMLMLMIMIIITTSWWEEEKQTCFLTTCQILEREWKGCVHMWHQEVHSQEITHFCSSTHCTVRFSMFKPSS